MLLRFTSVLEQYQFRRNAIITALCHHNIPLTGLDVIVTRGGTLKPLSSGIYRVTSRVVRDIRAGRVQTVHASLLGPLIAFELSKTVGKPAYFVDPESTDEFWYRARFSGLPEIPRRALSHALSVRSAALRVAEQLRRPLAACNFVVAHLGSGITVAALRKGKQVDASNANEDGPMSTQRSGALPIEGLVDLAYANALQLLLRQKWQDGRPQKPELESVLCVARRATLNRVQHQGGVLAYLGTDDITEVERLIRNGNQQARAVYDALIYQIAKEIGAYATVLKGKIDAIVLTGGMTHSRQLVRRLRAWISWIAPRVIVLPGEEEMNALVRAVIRLSTRKEKEKQYE